VKKIQNGGVHSEMLDGWTGTAANTARMFSPPPSPHQRRLLPLYIPTLISVSTSQYPIRPIRKYSRGVICRGRRCPIGRHRFFRRRAPRASTAVTRAGSLTRCAGDTSTPPAGQLYYRVWSDIILSRLYVTAELFQTYTHQYYIYICTNVADIHILYIN